MDCPTTSLARRIAWIRRGLRLQSNRRRSMRAAAVAAEPVSWPEFEREFWAYAMPTTERLHSLDRSGRPLLLILTVTDAAGHLLRVAACDPEDNE
jgi:hypothetical protein